MTDLRRSYLALFAAAASLVAQPALASSHREAPGISKIPKVDGTDWYMFRSYEPGRNGYVTMLANYQGLQTPGGGPSYYTLDPNAVYEMLIDNDGDGKEDITFQFKFSNVLQNNDQGITLNVGGKTVAIPLRAAGPVSEANDPNLNEQESYTLTMITGDRRTGARTTVANASGGGTTFIKPLDNIGNKTVPQYEAYIKPFIYTVNIPGCGRTARVFVGQRADAFAFNLGETFDLVNYIPIEGDSAPGAHDGKGFPGGITQNKANDTIVGKFNVTTLALEVPVECVRGKGNGVIGGWTTASLPQAQLLDPNATYAQESVQGGAYVQVSRLGMPLVNEVVIGLPVKDTFNASEPVNDAQFLDYVTNPTFPAILDKLFNAAVNKTLGTNMPTLAPTNFPRNDLVATFLTGFAGVNQLKTVTPSEMLRLNTAIPPTAQAKQSTFGVVGDDLAGFPNGRRPGDDIIDISLRVVMGRLCYPIPVNGKQTDLGLCKPADASTGQVAYTDGAPISAPDVQNVFPYLNSPIPGSPNSAVNAAAAATPGK